MIVHCQTCQADTILREGQATCSWCGTTPALSRPIPGRPGAALPHRIREPLGMSMRRVAIALLDRTDYPSILACQAGLFHQFYVRGWPTRSQKDASSLANRRRGPDETLAVVRERRTRCARDRRARRASPRPAVCLPRDPRQRLLCRAPERQDERARLLHAARRRSIATLPARHERTLERHARVVDPRARLEHPADRTRDWLLAEERRHDPLPRPPRRHMLTPAHQVTRTYDCQDPRVSEHRPLTAWPALVLRHVPDEARRVHARREARPLLRLAQHAPPAHQPWTAATRSARRRSCAQHAEPRHGRARRARHPRPSRPGAHRAPLGDRPRTRAVRQDSPSG
jgi:hypothetical protein